nr:hypothetical protein [Tanacetum cinerariifolium]
MRNRSSSNLIVESFTIPKRRNRRRSKQIVEPELRTIVETPVATMADTRTMSELLQAPTEGYRDAIVIAAILAKKFALKVGLLTLVTSSKFHGFERDDLHSHIRWFNKITSTLKYKNVPHEAIKLMLFSFSLKGAARIWLEKEPHQLHQIDTFYNAVTQSDQNCLNVAAGGNLLNRTPRDALTIIENKSKVRTSRNKSVVLKMSATTSSSIPAYLPEITALTDVIKAMLFQNKTPSPAHVKAMEETCVTCGGPHPYYESLATDGNTFNASAATGTYNQRGHGYRPQGETNYHASNQMRTLGNQNYQAPLNQTQVGPLNDFSNYMKTNDANMRAMQNEISTMKTELKNEVQTMMMNQNNKLKNMIRNFIQIHSPSGSGSLPSNTIPNSKGEINAITTQSGIILDGPSVPPPPPFASSNEVERDPNTITDQSPPASISSKIPHPPTHSSSELPKRNPHQPPILYPPRLNNEKLQDKSDIQVHKFLQMFKKLNFNINLVEALALMPKYHKMLKDLLSDKEKLLGLANTYLTENCSAKKLSLPGLTPTRMTLELATRSIAYLAGIAEDVFMQVGKFIFLADFVVVDYDINLRIPLILGRPFLRTARALVDVNGEELILRDGDEKLIFHADSTSKHPHTHGNESINMIKFIDIICKDSFPEVLKFKRSNHPLSGSTASLFDSLSSLTPFETSDSLLEEFADELTFLDPFPRGNEDDNFDPEADFRKIEYLLNQGPSTESDIDIIDPVLERFTDKPTFDYSPPPRDDDDDLLTLSLIMMNGKSFCMVIVTRTLTLKKIKTRTLK